MRTQTNRIARQVIAETGIGTVVFNDKLTDGSRSLKVWGWTITEYLQAKQRLEAAGCQVFLVQFATPVNFGQSLRSQIRLRVVE